MQLERDKVFRSRQLNALTSKLHFSGALKEFFPGFLLHKHEIDWRSGFIGRLKLGKTRGAVEKAITKIVLQIEPLGA
jgi:hypothetical protein